MDQASSAQLQRLAREIASLTGPMAAQMAGLQVQSGSMAAAMRSITESTRVNDSLLASVGTTLAAIRTPAFSRSLASINEANRSLATFVDDSRFKLRPEILESLSMAGQVGSKLALDQSVMASLAKLDVSRSLAASLAAQETLVSMRGLQVGGLIGADATFRRSTAAHFGQVTRSYSALMTEIASQTTRTAHGSVIASAAPIDYYRHVNTLQSVTATGPDVFTSETVEAAVDAGSPSVDELLSRFDGRLLPLLVGARQALEGGNTDRPRHVTTSLRELFTQVLHSLAPDDAVVSWGKATEADAARPTRRARLLYICRDIDDGPLVDFVKADVSAALALVDSLNAGTHTVQSRLTDDQLRAQVARMESLLCMLLQLAPPA